MTESEALLAYTLRLGDNALILGQRLIELVAGEAELEEELANANLALDYIGQARLFYSCAGEIEGKGRGEDDFAYLRDSRETQTSLSLTFGISAISAAASFSSWASAAPNCCSTSCSRCWQRAPADSAP